MNDSLWMTGNFPGVNGRTSSTATSPIAGLQLAKAAGATVIITSSSNLKLERARALGADHVINYRDTPGWGARAKAITGNRGVDVVLEVGGEQTLAQSEAALMPGGAIAAIGLLGGGRIKSVKDPLSKLHYIRVGNRDQFIDMNRAISANGIRPVVDKVFPLEQLAAAMRALQSGSVFGKVAIQL